MDFELELSRRHPRIYRSLRKLDESSQSCFISPYLKEAISSEVNATNIIIKLLATIQIIFGYVFIILSTQPIKQDPVSEILSEFVLRSQGLPFSSLLELIDQTNDQLCVHVPSILDSRLKFKEYLSIIDSPRSKQQLFQLESEQKFTEKAKEFKNMFKTKFNDVFEYANFVSEIALEQQKIIDE
ncbi:Hypothetical_protein [Hexamita inflata]|uniref:Hypothetical_protein n=1 Tax=Hexamita inflata TaxID=28002 RepID=A0AA86V441_9EUKA|nr:Hypothetical protein HINF_LOCUS43893 [Hexamita inflata]